MDLPQKKKNRLSYIFCLLIVIIIIELTIGFLNREKIYDWYNGIIYQPSAEMAAIRNSLNLTDYGEFLFNATQPTLNEADDFNQNCQKEESDVAVLGCYRNGNIYVYNVDSVDLKGIRELTAAHELLHAKWERMSDTERIELVPALTRVFDDNQDLLESEIETYDVKERQEELYVRAGTEIKNLPAILEQHFADIFNDQDAVVDFYESYITVFKNIKARMETLGNEMEDLKKQIDAKITNYELLADQLESDIVDFNTCAETQGCFSSEYEFNIERGGLLGRKESLNSLNDEINSLIDEYNEKVEEYNSDVTESHKLQDMINSNKTLEI